MAIIAILDTHWIYKFLLIVPNNILENTQLPRSNDIGP